MSDLPAPKTVCDRCNAAVDATDQYCRHCGAAVVAVGSPAQGNDVAADAPTAIATASAAARVARPRWSENPWVILPLLFLLLGPFALPMLWRSRCFPRLWKIILTIVVTVITVWICWQLWLVFQQAWGLVRDLEKAQAQGF